MSVCVSKEGRGAERRGVGGGVRVATFCRHRTATVDALTLEHHIKARPPTDDDGSMSWGVALAASFTHSHRNKNGTVANILHAQLHSCNCNCIFCNCTFCSPCHVMRDACFFFRLFVYKRAYAARQSLHHNTNKHTRVAFATRNCRHKRRAVCSM